MAKKEKKKEPEPEESELNEKQKLFCDLYVSKDFFANGVQAYIQAYNIDITKEGAYDAARANSSRLLTIDNIYNYINKLLDDAGLNDNFVDKQLLFMIQQQADFTAKLGAIKEYNKLKQRITDKQEVKLRLGKDFEEEKYE
jgi:hypothetical protein